MTDTENKNANTNSQLILCVACGRCIKACPVNLGITGVLAAMNEYRKDNDLEAARATLKELVEDKGHKLPTECLRCGACENECPQEIKIREYLEEAVKVFGLKKW